MIQAWNCLANVLINYKKGFLLENAIQEVVKKGEGEKAALKVKIGYLLKSASKTMKGVYIVEGQLQKAEDVDRFTRVLDLRWSALLVNREETMRRPGELPLEEDVSMFRDYTVKKINELVSSQDPFTAFQYNRLRYLVVARLNI